MPRVLTTTLLAVVLLLVGWSHLPGSTKTVNVEALDTAVGVRFGDPLDPATVEVSQSEGTFTGARLLRPPATHGTVRVARVDVISIDGSRSARNVRLGDAEGPMAIAQALQRAFGPPHAGQGAPHWYRTVMVLWLSTDAAAGSTFGLMPRDRVPQVPPKAAL